MSGVMSRNKGLRAEREVLNLLQAVVNEEFEHAQVEPPILSRNLVQTREGGYDIVGLDWLALEVKHQETFHVADWWRQTCRQAAEGQEPVLFYRRNKVRWRVMLMGFIAAGSKAVATPVDITLDSFVAYFKIRIQHELNRGK